MKVSRYITHNAPLCPWMQISRRRTDTTRSNFFILYLGAHAPDSSGLAPAPGRRSRRCTNARKLRTTKICVETPCQLSVQKLFKELTLIFLNKLWKSLWTWLLKIIQDVELFIIGFNMRRLKCIERINSQVLRNYFFVPASKFVTFVHRILITESLCFCFQEML